MTVTTLLYSIFIFLAAAVAVTARVFYYRLGKKAERLKDAENVLENVKKANTVSGDDAYDDELRKKYGLE